MPLFTNEEIISNTPLPVDGSGVTQPVSGTVTANVGTTGGLALDATLTGGTQKTQVVDTGGTNVLSVSAAGAAKVDGSAVTQPISAASLPLPTGAATETTLSAVNTKTPSLGQATMANSSPVVIASNQSAIPVTFTAANTTLAAVTSVSVSTSVATLSASNSAKTQVVVFNESGTLYVKLGTGASSASYTYRLTANTALEINGYAGVVTAIKASGTSAALVTEIGI